MAEYNVQPFPERIPEDDEEAEGSGSMESVPEKSAQSDIPEILTEPPAGDQLYELLSKVPMHLIPDVQLGTVEDRRNEYIDPRLNNAQYTYPALNYKPFHMPHTPEVTARLDANTPLPSINESGPLWRKDLAEVNDPLAPVIPSFMSVYGGKVTPEFQSYLERAQAMAALREELQRLEDYRLNYSRTYIAPDPERARMVQQALESLTPKRR